MVSGAKFMTQLASVAWPTNTMKLCPRLLSNDSNGLNLNSILYFELQTFVVCLE